MTEHFLIPKTLEKLVSLGIWPSTDDEVRRQNVHPLVSLESIKAIAPEEIELGFYAPPFRSIQQDLSTSSPFWEEFGALDEIDPAACLILGDFGIGADAVLVMDYSDNPAEPCIKRLVWGKDGNYWEVIANDFDEFAAKVKLVERSNTE